MKLCKTTKHFSVLHSGRYTAREEIAKNCPARCAYLASSATTILSFSICILLNIEPKNMNKDILTEHNNYYVEVLR